MAAVVDPHPVIGELVHALGLPDGVLGFSLHVPYGDIITVECTYLPTAEQVEALHEVVKRYGVRVEEIEDAHEASDVRGSTEGTPPRQCE